MPRETKDILKYLCSYDLSAANPMKRLPHDCYMILVSRLRPEKIKILLEMNLSKGVKSNEEYDPIQAEYTVLNSEEAESILEHVALEGITEQLEKQKSHLAYEDNFNSSVVDMLDTNLSYEKLKRGSTRKLDKIKGQDRGKIFFWFDPLKRKIMETYY